MLRNPRYVHGPTHITVPATVNFGSFILDTIWKMRTEVAIINGATDESVTYGEIAQQAMNLALSLTRMGIRRGHTIAISSENRTEFLCTVIAVACTGAICTPINLTYTKDELKHVLGISKPSHIFCSPLAYKAQGATYRSLGYVKQIILYGGERQDSALLYNDLIAATRAELRGDVSVEQFQAAEVRGQTDTLLVLYSSGTTGLPKGVMLTHLNVIVTMKIDDSVPSDVYPILLLVAPWFHAMGLMATLTFMASGRRMVYLPKYETDLFMKTIEKYKITEMTVAPPIVVAVAKAQEQYDLSSVRYIKCGAAPLHKDTSAEISSRFPNLKGLLQGYGLTECTLAVSRHMPDGIPTKIGSVGPPVPEMVVKVVDVETRKPLGPNKSGEICIKGPTVMMGYVGRDRREDFDEEGFYKTGDIGYYDEDKYFYIVDRLKELIKYKGYQVPPAEVEAVLLQHAGVRDAGVVGVSRPAVGEVPAAFVVTQPGWAPTEDELRHFVAERLSSPKHLRGGVRFVDAIPKNPSGKILRRELRKMADGDKSKL